MNLIKKRFKDIIGYILISGMLFSAIAFYFMHDIKDIKEVEVNIQDKFSFTLAPKTAFGFIILTYFIGMQTVFDLFFCGAKKADVYMCGAKNGNS